MSNLPTVQYSPLDYEAIEAAVVETERGRWFLAEYQRRNRHADTRQVLEAIERMQMSLAETVSASMGDHEGAAKADPTIDVLRQDLIEMAMRIAETHTEVAELASQDQNPRHVDLVSGELDAIVRSTEQATSEILESAEQIQEIAWTLREGGLAVETCDAIDQRATNIYLACSFQDLTAQRATKVIETMRFLENRINKMIGLLQGVEGFTISDLASEVSEHARDADLDESDRTLLQNDVDFALQWESEQQNEAEGGQGDVFAAFAGEGREPAAAGWEPKAAPEPMFSDDGVIGADEGCGLAAPAEVEAQPDTAASPVPAGAESAEIIKPAKTTGPADYLDESDISASLDPLPEAETGEDRDRVVPVLRLAATGSVSGEGDTTVQAAPLHGHDRLSSLEALDQEALDRKFSLFT